MNRGVGVPDTMGIGRFIPAMEVLYTKGRSISRMCLACKIGFTKVLGDVAIWAAKKLRISGFLEWLRSKLDWASVWNRFRGGSPGSNVFVLWD